MAQLLTNKFSRIFERPLLAICAIAAATVLASCQSNSKAESKSADVGKGLPPLVQADGKKITEVLSIQEYTPVAGPSNETAAVAAAVLLPMANSALKWVNEQAWKKLDAYADQFGRSYGKTLSSTRYRSLPGDTQHIYRFVFRRTVTFENKDLAKQILGLAVEGTEVNKNKFAVVVVEIPFTLITSGDTHRSWRFISLTSPALKAFDQKLLYSDGFPNKAKYIARAAKALNVRDIDKFEIVISASARIAENTAGGPTVFVSDSVVTKIKGDKIKDNPAVSLDGDWFPASMGKAFSVSLNVVETSRLKDWLKKAAAKGKEKSDEYIDTLFDS